jgi:hypothetical protein
MQIGHFARIAQIYAVRLSEFVRKSLGVNQRPFKRTFFALRFLREQKRLSVLPGEAPVIISASMTFSLEFSACWSLER